MTVQPERWRQIENLSHSAAALPPGEREAFLEGPSGRGSNEEAGSDLGRFDPEYAR